MIWINEKPSIFPDLQTNDKLIKVKVVSTKQYEIPNTIEIKRIVRQKLLHH